MMKTASTCLFLAMLIAGCGGGSSDGSADAADSSSSSAASAPTLAQRSAAAHATAESTSNDCGAIAPFYWELGSATQRQAAGSVAKPGGVAVYGPDTTLNIASASKWLYAGYAIQREPQPSDQTVQYLTFRSGYTQFTWCLPGQTVQQCAQMLNNDVQDPTAVGKFYYGGGHMQQHAVLIGLGALDNAGLAAELQTQLGSDIALAYSQPQPAGGVMTSASQYARFLRKLMDGTLALGAQLGTHAACTNPATCSDALYTPIPQTESDHYSLGHWVEDDPVAGDGAFSSPGAFGFYPWIDARKQTYGVIAREATSEDSAGYHSALCGRLIRRAWSTGVAQ